nr:O-antigen ligase family protein [Devosia oryzisoli]
MLHKNFAGPTAAITILFLAFGGRGINRWVKLGLVAAAAYFLYRTHSKTSLGLLVPALLLGWTYLAFGARRLRLVVPFLVLAVIIALVGYGGELAAIIDINETPDALSGRGSIWPILIEYANAHPVTGAGFGSFWNIGPDSPVFGLAASWVATLGNGHNGYLDTLTQLGYPGLIMAAGAVVLLPGWRLVTDTRIHDTTGALLLSLLVFCAFHNLTETSLLDRDVGIWLFMVFVVAGIGKASREGALVRSGLPRGQRDVAQ